MSPFPPIPFRSHGFPHLYNNVVTIGNRWPQEPLPLFWPGAFRQSRGPEATTEEQPGPSADPLVSRLIAFPLFSAEESHPLPGSWLPLYTSDLGGNMKSANCLQRHWPGTAGWPRAASPSRSGSVCSGAWRPSR